MIGNSSTEGNPNQDKNCGQNGLFSPNTSEGRNKSKNAISQKFNKAKEPIIMIDSFYEDKQYVYAINPIIKYPIVAIAAHASA